MPRLILVTDRRLMGDDLPGAIASALRGAPAGTTWVQLREKDLGGRELWALASAAREVCHAAGARLLVNDRIDIALAAGADGVHLPEQGLSVALLGMSFLNRVDMKREGQTMTLLRRY